MRSWEALLLLPLLACSRDTPAPAPAPSASSQPAPSDTPAQTTPDGTDAKSPALSPDDARFVDAHRGRGWGDRCFAELKEGKLGWARAACDRGLALPDLDPEVKPALLYNEGLIAEKSVNLASARTYFEQSLALRPATDVSGRAAVEKELRLVGGTVPSAPSAPVSGKLECRASDGTKTIELFLGEWDHGAANGSLRVTTAAGPTVQAVLTSQYKGLFVIEAGGKPTATIYCDGAGGCPVGKETISLGNSPALPCE
jgi:hypothetical protein